ncbi:hypothetical protein Poli38472_007555 [Pythium oligandrum]|uniref:ABC transporter domain-containing protein n=1 Tax=Pythium oligandrum TaxID=41045 RepID=A0A8K1CT97_PYTOL|nr:hypothetical protein Poli38472_007555 [Pythium oligandrum]|eukprot:TMW67883.1 hypothetical protein Poli38472_007555 [Pythium oligandrum]
MTETKTIEYTSGKALMALGPERLHQHLSTRMETALGKAMHQMEARFRDVSISATSNHGLGKYVGLSSETKTKHILKDVSGVFKPGSMTLVLGQPGSGKSSLMQLLSGRFPESKGVRIDGDVTYNGVSRSEIKKRLPQFVSHVTLRDHHFPTLTVKETLEFAHECSGGLEFSQRLEPLLSKATPEENKAAHDAVRSLHEHFPDVVIQQLGMEH